jgi:hypothetical protein
MAVRVKMCGIDTDALGMEWGLGNELTGSELNLGYIGFALYSWLKHPRREADHSLPSRTDDKNGWI